MKKKNNKSTLRWIIQRLMPQAWWIALLMLVYAIMALCGVYTALAARNVIDNAVNKNTDGVLIYGGALIAILVLQVVLRILNSALSFRVGTKLENSMAEDLFKKILEKEYSEISEYHTGELMNRINGDVTVITSAVTNILPQLAYVCVKLAGIFVVLCSVDPLFAAVFAVGGAAVWGASALFKGKMKALHKKVQTSNGKVRSFFQEMLGSTLVIKAFAAEKKARDTSHGLLEENYKIKRKRMFITSFSSAGISFVFSAAYLYGMIWGAMRIVAETITYGTFTAILSLISQVQLPVSALSSAFPLYYSALASAERIMQIEDIPDEPAADESIDPKAIYEQLDCIAAENISFSYGTQEIFTDTGVVLKKGEFAVISGISGIGKSTLLKLIMGVFPPNNGQILLRLKNGETHVSDKSARPLFAYVPQGNFLLSGTIRENLCFANENPSDEELHTALKTACCGFVDTLPHGLETKIGENGHGLSEGQVQRLAVARALLGGAPVLLLDEATSALDEATEVELLKNLRALKEKTCILITHKTAALEVCDKKIEIVSNKIIIADSKGDQQRNGTRTQTE